MPVNETSPFSTSRARARRQVTVSAESLVRTEILDETGFPLVLRPALSGVDLADWMRANTDTVKRRLLAHGALLFRGFDIGGPEEFRAVAQAFTPSLLDYRERAAPRKEIESRVYTSTEMPPDQRIPLHHEMSYSHNWPLKIWFYCQQPAAEGGCTPIADDRRVIRLLPAELKRKFMERKVMYVRNYGEGVDLPWQEAFQTTDPKEVEAFGDATGMQIEWQSGTRLRTTQVRQAIVTHPETGDHIWFNHAHMFHQSNLPHDVREALLAQFDPREMPRNAFYGDGTPFDGEELALIRDIYDRTAVRFAWQKGDILLLDNVLGSHGRDPYAGPRTILVALAELYTHSEAARPSIAAASTPA